MQTLRSAAQTCGELRSASRIQRRLFPARACGRPAPPAARSHPDWRRAPVASPRPLVADPMTTHCGRTKNHLATLFFSVFDNQHDLAPQIPVSNQPPDSASPRSPGARRSPRDLEGQWRLLPSRCSRFWRRIASQQRPLAISELGGASDVPEADHAPHRAPARRRGSAAARAEPPRLRPGPAPARLCARHGALVDALGAAPRRARGTVGAQSGKPAISA